MTWLTAGNLVVTKGEVKAHTEVFGDSSIDPLTTRLYSHLTIKNNIESIRGSIDISMRTLKSDNKDRDEHMIGAIEVDKFPLAKYTFKDVQKSENGYIIKGMLNFHGIQKPLSIQAHISKKNNELNIKGTSSFLMSDYHVKPPKMLFLTVRDQVDLVIDVKFTIR